MDTHNYHTLAKLKNLESTLCDLLEKVDKEINQTEVEWLQLKSISETQRTNVSNNSVSTNKTMPVKREVQNEVLQPKTAFAKIERDIDDNTINSVLLNLNPKNCQGTDEEFDSD